MVVFLLFQLAINLGFGNKKILGASVVINSQKILQLTNKERERIGLKALKKNEVLTKAAEKKLENMFEMGYWDHLSPDNKPVWPYIVRLGYDYHFAGENLAKDFLTEEAVVKAWMESPQHRQNILNEKYEDVGIAYANGKLNGKDTILFVQIFGKEYKKFDYLSVTEKNGESNLSFDRKIGFKDFFANKFIASKTAAFFIVITLMFYLGIKLGKEKKKKMVYFNLKKYWGHFIFLITLGIIIYLTKDGNVL